MSEISCPVTISIRLDQFEKNLSDLNEIQKELTTFARILTEQNSLETAKYIQTRSDSISVIVDKLKAFLSPHSLY